MKVVPKVVEINNLLTVQLEKNNHELDHIEKNILVHPNIPAFPPPPLRATSLRVCCDVNVIDQQSILEL